MTRILFLLTQLSQIKVFLHNSPFHCVFPITRVVAEEKPRAGREENIGTFTESKTSGEVFQKAPLVFLASSIISKRTVQPSKPAQGGKSWTAASSTGFGDASCN